jgi:hypothetical protein
MIWPLFLTKSLSFTKTIDTSPKAVIAVLHDPQVFTRLQPFVIAVTPSGLNSSQFTITEALHILGCFKANTTFKLTIDMRPMG